MRVKVEFVVEVSDDIRREINAWYGRPGLASRDEIKAWYEANGRSMDDDLGWSADQTAEAENG
jgi:hypothetical protein